MSVLLPLTTALSWMVLLAQVILVPVPHHHSWHGGVWKEVWWRVFLTRSDCLCQWQKTDMCGCNMHTQACVLSTPCCAPMLAEAYHAPYTLLCPELSLCSLSPGLSVEPYNAFFHFSVSPWNIDGHVPWHSSLPSGLPALTANSLCSFVWNLMKREGHFVCQTAKSN